MPLKCIVLVAVISLFYSLQSYTQNNTHAPQSWQLSQQYLPPDVCSGIL